MQRPTKLVQLLLCAPLLALAQSSGPEQAAPPTAAPTAAPPPPPQTPPPPAADQMPGQVSAEAPPVGPQQSNSGQWVYTSQYGWVWMPYEPADTFVPPNGGVPEMYVYYPSAGWVWIAAPWVWGLGPRPYFVFGPAHYVWWGRGFGRWYGFAPKYANWGPRGYWVGGRWTAPRVHYVEPHELARVPAHPAVREGHAGHGHR